MPSRTVKSTIQHDGQTYSAGDVVELTEDQARELDLAGALEATEEDNRAEVAASAPPAGDDEQLERGQVDDQVAAAVNQDLADNERLANTPGQPIVNNKAQSGLASKIKSAVTGHQAPTTDEIANDPQLK